MLTSSGAKWRCMWHMLVWCVLLTLGSQFLKFHEHVAFYCISGICIFILPWLTANYCNTSGQHGAGLLRAGYVLCDPVLACLSVSPLLVNRTLQPIVANFQCRLLHSRQEQVDCFNQTGTSIDGKSLFRGIKSGTALHDMLKFECFMVIPIVMALFMGRRTSKMKCSTYFSVTFYWFIVAIDLCSFIESVAELGRGQVPIRLPVGVCCVALILGNSYALVTLSSYVSPASSASSRLKFNFIYKALIASLGIILAELPMAFARIRAMQVFWAVNTQPGKVPISFYLWLARNLMTVAIVLVTVVHVKIGTKCFTCSPLFDSPDVFFLPEKRDIYIHQSRKVREQNSANVDEEATRHVGKKVSFDVQETDSILCD